MYLPCLNKDDDDDDDVTKTLHVQVALPRGGLGGMTVKVPKESW